MYTGTPTPKLGLPQWNPTDHPDFLTDLNQAFKDIDRNASETSEEIAGYPQRLEELETLTQSLNEDTQQLIGDMSSVQVAISNLKTESEKIDPMEVQIQGLQSSVGGQGDIIRNIITLTTRQFDKTELNIVSDDGKVQIARILRIGQIFEFGIKILEPASGIEHSTFNNTIDRILELMEIQNINNPIIAIVDNYYYLTAEGGIGFRIQLTFARESKRFMVTQQPTGQQPNTTSIYYITFAFTGDIA